ncbi:MAG: UDP-glucose--hexose-1-phosphate uridylyltransferase [Clostridia bacterium]|nr:UDP-glucose--hexose-1-phosphate uridylyltransferase [Clostridia bacterium]
MKPTATESIYRLVDFAVEKGLVAPIDRAYTVNRLLEIMGMDAPEAIDYAPEPAPETATAYLEALCDRAVEAGILQDSGERRDLFCGKLMGAVTPHPAMVREKFAALRETLGPERATAWFYQLCRDVDYIKVDRIAKNARFFEDSPAGRLEITINLSKPEKDPRDIAAQRSMKQTAYPKCMLCVENPGYAGRPGFPARQNHRVIPLSLSGKPWYLQYSPYLYYNEHCIVFNHEHIPMKIDRGTFVRLFDFVDLFPHYFLGSNADLPIVGGSILSHDHFQGGNHRFPMDDAGVRIPLAAPVDGVTAHVADWPMTCVVLEGKDRDALVELADEMLVKWRGWTDVACGVYAETDGTPHNTITPIARRVGDGYRLSLVLRNNRTSEQHPLGIFHPHADLHHVKKENIGLIEVMGLFILPGRLLSELEGLKDYLTGRRAVDDAPGADSPLDKHYEWVRDIAARRGVGMSDDEADAALRQELAVKCARVLADAGVYKQTEEGDRGIVRFLSSLGYKTV